MLGDPSVLAPAALGVAGAIAGWPLARLAARRAVRQPITTDADAEAAILREAAADPAWASSSGLDAGHFTTSAARRAWGELVPEGADGDATHTDLRGDEAGADRVALVRRLAEAREDRELGGALAVHAGDDRPWREVPRVGAVRGGVAAAVLACGGVLAGWVASSSLVALALVVLVATGYTIASVDHDTLYLDITAWWSGAALVWAVLAVERFANDDLKRVGWALVAGAVWWAALELLNVAYRVLRGTDGLGGGDGMIAFTTVGATYVVTGSAYAALWAVLAGLLVALVVSIPMMLLARRGMRTAFALGPFLALGWQLALVAWQLGWIVL